MLLTTLFSAVALIPAATVGPPMKLIWGPTELPNGSSAYPLYEELGVDVLQLHLRWDRVATRRPRNPHDPAAAAYRWPRGLRHSLREAEQRGIAIALLVTGAPGWANGGRSREHAPLDTGDFAD